MFQIITKIMKWLSLPALLAAPMLSRGAGSHELMVDVVLCLCATILVRRAVRLEEYFWAAGFVTAAIVLSPLLLVFKIFLLLGFTSIAMFASLLMALRMQPLLALRR